MKILKLTLVFIFVCTLALGVAAQKKRYKNEIDGYNFFNSGKLNSLVVAESTEEDVIKIFGSNCKSRCDYNEDWKLWVMYFENAEVISQTIGMPEFEVNPKLLGKIMLIKLIPNEPISFTDHKFSRKFKKIGGKIERRLNGNPLRTVFFKSYVDNKGLAYLVFDHVLADSPNQENKEKHTKGDLMSVEYRLTDKQARKMFVKKK